MKNKLTYGPALLGFAIGASLFSTTISCGEVQSACAADCPVDDDGRLAALEERVTSLQAQVDALSTKVESVHQPVWIAHFTRTDASTLSYTLPDGTVETLAIGDGTAPVTGTHIAYRPGSNGDAGLYFDLATAPSVACTLLHNDDDVLRGGEYFATDTGNSVAAIWGNTTTRTFMFARQTVSTFGLGINTGYAIACF